MRNLYRILLWLILLTAFMTFAGMPIASAAEKVFYIKQSREFKEISESSLQLFRKTIERAEAERARALILELDTPGGSVETAFKFLSVMEKSKVPIIVYLHPNGISAGLILALGADKIAISPNGLIGDAMPVTYANGAVKPITEPPGKAPETPQDPAKLPDLLKALDRHTTAADDKALADQKFLSVYFKMLQVLAEKNQRPVRVIRAMADPYVILTMQADKFEHNQKSPLTLSAREALKLKVVDYIVTDRDDLLRQLGFQDAQIVEASRSLTGQLGDFLASPLVTTLLLILGLVGLFVEIKTPGFGISGTLGVTALTLFFLGHIASGDSSWGPVVVFFVGLLLILLEIFVVPGFGLVGISGIGCLVTSFLWAFGWENILYASRTVSIALIAAITIMILLTIYVLPKTPLFRKTSLKTAIDSSEGFKAVEIDETLIGCSAVAVTDLHPSGAVEINGKRYDAASEDGFLEAATELTVTGNNGFQLLVRRKNV